MNQRSVVVVGLICGILGGSSLYFGLVAARWMDRYDQLALDSVHYWRFLYENATNRSFVYNLSFSNLSLSVLDRVDQLLAEKDLLVSEVSQLRRDNDVLQGLIAGKNLTGPCAETIARLNAQIKGLNNDVFVLREKISDLQRNISGLNSVVSFLSPFKTRYERASSNWSVFMNWYAPENMSAFLTPSDPVVVSKCREILGDGFDGDLTWSDMRSIVLWVHDNIRYVDLWVPEFGYNWSFWQLPADVLASGYGDSSDLSRLAASLMMAEDEHAEYVWCIEVVLSGFSRTAVAVDVAQNQMMIYDPVSGWQSNIGSETWALEEFAKRAGSYLVNVPVAYNKKLVKIFGSVVEFCQAF